MKNDYNQVTIRLFRGVQIDRIDNFAVHGVALQPGKQIMVYT